MELHIDNSAHINYLKKKTKKNELMPLEKLSYRLDNHFVHLHVWRRGQSKQNRL